MTPEQIALAFRKWLLATDEFRFFLEEYATKTDIESKKEAARENCDMLYRVQDDPMGVLL